MSGSAADGPDPDEIVDVSVEELADTSSSHEITEKAFNDLDASTGLGGDGLDGAEATSDSGEPILDVMAVVEAERDGYLSDLQRVTAEFANYRKQAERRTREVRARASGDLAEKLLPVLDACDLAVEHGADDVGPIRVSLVHALEPAGLEVLDPEGELFDPNLHEAVIHEPASEGESGQVVVEVLRRGYAWEGRVLRPAMVRVRG